MSLWWVKREQLDRSQIELIENLPLRENHLIYGPPGSGKTNVLLRRAQFVRSQDMPNVLVMTFTRTLTEFVRTGCVDAQDREIFPRSCVTTLESWLRSLYKKHDVQLPADTQDLPEWKRQLASGALNFRAGDRQPVYDALFVDEAQDLLPEEIQVLEQWSPVLFFTADDRQKIYGNADGLKYLRSKGTLNEHPLNFHYRVCPELCKMADRILVPANGASMESTCHYNGPRPGAIEMHGPMTKDAQVEAAAELIKEQIRVYEDFIKQGDRIGIIVARTEDRDFVAEKLEEDWELMGQSKILRARLDEHENYDPSFDPQRPISIVTVQGCKGLEFRAVHWLFCEELKRHHGDEHYYTVVTRAKTRLDVSFARELPDTLARAHSTGGKDLW
jgi:superfamily I DNA/RNA helicase